MATFADGPFFLPLAAWLSVALAAPALSAQTIVRVHDGVSIPGPLASTPEMPTAQAIAPPATCSSTATAFQGQPVPGGGTLNPLAFNNAPTLNASGRLAFFAQVNGSPRNQGIFVASAGVLTPIAMGCGGGGGSGMPGNGCGDPTPIGGTFSGFFSGTPFAPAINDAGDVLFLADVNGGANPRGLFLRRASTGAIEKVSAVGDQSPIGGAFITGVGPGSLNNAGVVVFLARHAGGANVNLLRWQQGVVTKVAAVGDAAPGGGTFQLLAGESFGFADGTSIPTGPVPGINDLGQVAFRAIVTGGNVSRGLLVSTGGVHSWYVRAGDPTPAGGTFLDFQAASINAASQIAFFADFQAATAPTSGWFVGRPGSWRKAVAFFDPIDDGQCFGLAFSRNPIRPLDDFGNVVVWTVVKHSDQTQEERILFSPASAPIATLAKQGDVAPAGGAFGTFQAWPAANDMGGVAISAATPGAPATSAHFVAQLCGPALSSISPAAGPKAGGTLIALFGSGFALDGLPTVTIGGVPAASVSLLSNEGLLATTPAGAMGPADVTVSNAFGSVTLAGGFVYTPAVLVSPTMVPPGGTLQVENDGAPGESFVTWGSSFETSLDFAPFGKLLVVPEFELLGPVTYPFSGIATANLEIPADPMLSGATLHLQSLSFASLVPLVASFTNSATFTIQ